MILHAGHSDANDSHPKRKGAPKHMETNNGAFWPGQHVSIAHVDGLIYRGTVLSLDDLGVTIDGVTVIDVPFPDRPIPGEVLIPAGRIVYVRSLEG